MSAAGMDVRNVEAMSQPAIRALWRCCGDCSTAAVSRLESDMIRSPISSLHVAVARTRGETGAATLASVDLPPPRLKPLRVLGRPYLRTQTAAVLSAGV